jgi:hypothetical protein
MRKLTLCFAFVLEHHNGRMGADSGDGHREPIGHDSSLISSTSVFSVISCLQIGHRAGSVKI